MKSIEELIEPLSAAGYKGDCLEKEHLRYAVRVGACSWQYLHLLSWLEEQILCCRRSSRVTKSVIKDFDALFRELRTSYIKMSKDSAYDPTEFRYKMLQYLIGVLMVSHTDGVNRTESTMEADSEKPIKRAIELITLNVSLQKPVEDQQQPIKVSEELISAGQIEEEVASVAANGKAFRFALVSDQIPTGEIFETDWHRLKTELLTVITKLAEEDKSRTAVVDINLNRIKYEDQIRVAECADQYSAYLLKRAVEQLSAVENVDVIEWDRLSTEFVATAWTSISEKYDDLSILLDLIALHNPICTDNWMVIKVDPTQGSTQNFLLKLCRSALPILRGTGGFLNFGSERISVRLNKELRSNFDFSSLEMGSFIK